MTSPAGRRCVTLRKLGAKAALGFAGEALENGWKGSRPKGGEPGELRSDATRRLRQYLRRFGWDCFWFAFPVLVVVAVLLVASSGPRRPGSTAVNPSGMGGMTTAAFENAMA